jgi:hypothetical protein
VDHNVEGQERPYTQLGKGACQSFTLSQTDSAGLVEGFYKRHAKHGLEAGLKRPSSSGTQGLVNQGQERVIWSQRRNGSTED